jgi:hypothetical protein
LTRCDLPGRSEGDDDVSDPLDRLVTIREALRAVEEESPSYGIWDTIIPAARRLGVELTMDDLPDCLGAESASATDPRCIE